MMACNNESENDFSTIHDFNEDVHVDRENSTSVDASESGSCCSGSTGNGSTGNNQQKNENTNKKKREKTSWVWKYFKINPRL